jgi:RecJ-like exonuclease
VTLPEARRVLGLVNGYDTSALRAAFVDAIKADHPDNGGTGLNIGKITEAKDVLELDLLGKLPCPQCKGRGSIPSRLGASECSRCGGEGTL